MSKWFTAKGQYRCSRCRDPIYPSDIMRFDDAGYPVCQDCGGWPR